MNIKDVYILDDRAILYLNGEDTKEFLQNLIILTNTQLTGAVGRGVVELGEFLSIDGGAHGVSITDEDVSHVAIRVARHSLQQQALLAESLSVSWCCRCLAERCRVLSSCIFK